MVRGSAVSAIHVDRAHEFRMRIIFGTLLYRYFWVIGPHIWRELRENTFVPLHKSEKEYNDEVRAKISSYRMSHAQIPQEPLLHFMGRMFAREDGTVSPIDVFWSACLVLRCDTSREG